MPTRQPSTAPRSRKTPPRKRARTATSTVREYRLNDVLRPSAVTAMFSIDTKTLWRWRRDPRRGFPRPLELGPASIGWTYRSLLEWQQTLVMPSGRITLGRMGPGVAAAYDERLDARQPAQHQRPLPGQNARVQESVGREMNQR